ncbi:hypothetical protein [Melghirimyces algeriensis]|uniref:Uncharacterized protein n=1 Tax=Melghirimyces algeriensis TaxID=910412 RepID=A0A521AKI4_9BACL|nr:hypothetical protein [Melghirimyces algeriensis]SMO35170.1 hypothetical protein SAMN06264849_101191 [Melghirimyces algeriensis]
MEPKLTKKQTEQVNAQMEKELRDSRDLEMMKELQAFQEPSGGLIGNLLNNVAGLVVDIGGLVGQLFDDLIPTPPPEPEPGEPCNNIQKSKQSQ